MTQILGDVQPNETLVVDIHRKYKCDLPSFGMLGNTERRMKVDSIDMHGILKNASKGATWLFWEFIERRNPKTNKVRYLPTTTGERRKLTKAFKELHNKEVLKRIHRGEYLINPKSYIPAPTENYEDVWKEWKKLP